MPDIPIYLAGALDGKGWSRSPDCPECAVPLETREDCTIRCGYCEGWYRVEVDGDADEEGRLFNLFRVTPAEPPDWREEAGDERYHRNC